MSLPTKSRQKGGRTVRHTLKDGSVKVYHYDRHQRRATARAPDSTAELIAAYQRSPEWHALAPESQRHYVTYLRQLMLLGAQPVTEWTRREILTLRDALAGRNGPGAANAFVRTASALFRWAVDREWVEHSPVTRIKALPGGHLTAWTRAEADRAEAELPIHLARVVALGRFTGLRRSDLCALGWSAYDGRSIRLVQQKTRQPQVVPVHPTLKAHLDRWPRVAATILTNSLDRPWTPAAMTLAMRTALGRIGFAPGLNIHGLRKLAATSLAEAGCSAHEIAAVTGHRSLSMVQLYTRSADQERLASAAIVRLSEWTDKYDNATKKSR